MTRQEQINNASNELSESFKCSKTFKMGFEAGVQWADANPKSPWISVKDDLPYKHKELISPDDKRDTKYVFTLINGCISLNMMYKLDGKWYWQFGKPTHWMIIPEPPK